MLPRPNELLVPDKCRRCSIFPLANNLPEGKLRKNPWLTATSSRRNKS
jgi:hypothetical protein